MSTHDLQQGASARRLSTRPWRYVLDSQTLKLTWPLLALAPALLVLLMVGLVVQGVGEIVTSNGTRWERAQQGAVVNLGRYADSCSPADYEAYQAHMDVLQAFERARRALFAPQADLDAARAAYQRFGLLESEARLLVHVLPRLQSFPLHQKATVIWEQANTVAREIDGHGCIDPQHRAAALAPVYAAEQRLVPLRTAFDEASRQGRWALDVAVVLGMAVLAVPITLTGFLLTARLQRRASAAADALAVSEQRLQQALTGSGYGLWDLPLGGGAVVCSGTLMALLGHEARACELDRDDFIALVHPQDRLAFAQLLRARGADGQRLDTELRLRGHDEGYRWFRLAGQRTRVGEDQSPRIVGSLADVTERRKMQQLLEDELALRGSALHALRSALARMVTNDDALPTMPAGLSVEASQDEIGAITQAVARVGAQLRETNERLEAVFSLSPDAFVSFDSHQRISLASHALGGMTGLDVEALQGQAAQVFFARLQALCGPHSPQPSLQALQLRAGGEPFTVVLATTPPRTLSLELRPGSHPKVRHVLCLRDVTQQREVERLKSEFITVAAHELRTPMTLIFGYVELLMRRPLDEGRRAGLHAVIHEQCQRMVRILDELMDLGQLEARRGQELEVARVDLGALLREAANGFDLPTGRQAPQLRDPATWPEAHMAGDADRLVKVIRNIVHNAYKFSAPGTPVQIALGRRATAQGMDELCISVIDQGIGMTPEQLARVGERFFRADDSGRILGAGLGMSIVNEIVKLHGGQVRLHSTPGEGTQVDICLPALPSEGRFFKAPAQAPLASPVSLF
jgi:signal transduction histidine kinase